MFCGGIRQTDGRAWWRYDECDMALGTREKSHEWNCQKRTIAMAAGAMDKLAWSVRSDEVNTIMSPSPRMGRMDRAVRIKNVHGCGILAEI